MVKPFEHIIVEHHGDFQACHLNQHRSAYILTSFNANFLIQYTRVVKGLSPAVQ